MAQVMTYYKRVTYSLAPPECLSSLSGQLDGSSSPPLLAAQAYEGLH